MKSLRPWILQARIEEMERTLLRCKRNSTSCHIGKQMLTSLDLSNPAQYCLALLDDLIEVRFCQLELTHDGARPTAGCGAPEQMLMLDLLAVRLTSSHSVDRLAFFRLCSVAMRDPALVTAQPGSLGNLGPCVLLPATSHAAQWLL